MTTSIAVGLDGLHTRSPDGLDTVQWLDAAGRLRTERVSSALLHEDFASVPPLREGVQYQNRLNRHSRYFFLPERKHTFCESALEADALMRLEFEQRIVRVSSQPMLMLFQAGSKVLRHYPDFFGVAPNGDLVVYDVKPSGRMNDAVRDQFDETARLCAQVGWRHEVVHEDHAVRTMNLQWLRAARQSQYHPTSKVFEHILTVFDGGRPADEGSVMVDMKCPARGFAHIRHLVWHGYLTTDLTVPVDTHSVLRTTKKGSSCVCER